MSVQGPISMLSLILHTLFELALFSALLMLLCQGMKIWLLTKVQYCTYYSITQWLLSFLDKQTCSQSTYHVEKNGAIRLLNSRK